MFKSIIQPEANTFLNDSNSRLLLNYTVTSIGYNDETLATGAFFFPKTNYVALSFGIAPCYDYRTQCIPRRARVHNVMYIAALTRIIYGS